MDGEDTSIAGEAGESEQDAPPSAGSELRAVVVHAAGAVCTRRAVLDLPVRAGSEETVAVRLTGLPPALPESSLRGRVVSGPAGLRVTDARVDVAGTLRRGPELPELRLDLEDAEDRLARLSDRRDRLTQEIAQVAAFRAEPPTPRRGDPPRWAPVESLLSLAGFVDSRLGVLHERLRAAEEDLERAGHEVDVLVARIDRSSSAEPADRVEHSVSAVLTLAFEPAPDGGPAAAADSDRGGEDPAPGTTPVELEVEYQVPGATWAPVYQLRLDASGGAGTLVLRACVAQRTGEDWTGVRLGLSTADLMRRTDLPELRSLRIGRSQPAPAALSWREPPSGLNELFSGYDAVAAPVGTRGGGGGEKSPRTASPVFGGMDLPVPVAVAGPPAPAPALPAQALPPPPAPMAPGGMAEIGAAADTDGFGGAPPAVEAGAVAYGMAKRAYEPRRRTHGRAPGSAPRGGPPAVQPGAPAGPSPDAELLDYGRLTMAAPDAPAGRGTLRPSGTFHPLVSEFRLRAESVARLSRPTHAVDVRAAAGSFDYRFDTAATADVEADGQWHTVPVSEVPVDTEFGYVCVPALDTSVFGTVQVTNTSAHALLAGPADVMVDGDFVLTAPLPTLAPGQRQQIGLGVAESVQVARRTHMRESTAGLRGGTTVLDHTVEVEVANRFPYPVVVEVRERIPVSSDKDVRIEEHKAQPAWTEADEPLTGQDDGHVRGARVWRVPLEPGRTATLSGGFEIRLPVGKSVVGGNRRN